MNTIIDQIIDATPAFPLGNQANRVTSTTRTVAPLRGYATPVADPTGDILAQTGLNWRVHELPVLVQGSRETRVIKNRKALVHGRTGDVIEVVSDSFRVHQNTEIVGGLADIITTAGGVVTSGGYIPESGRVFLTGKLRAHADTSVRQLGDVTELEIVVSGGHKPGTPRIVKARALRLVCLNGLTVLDRISNVIPRVTHQTAITSADADALRAWADGVTGGFFQLARRLTRLQATPASRAVLDAVAVQATAGQDVLAALVGAPSLSGAELIEEILRRDERERETRGVVDWLLNPGSADQDRLAALRQVPHEGKRILQHLEVQPGAHYTHGTLSHVVNAASYWADHVRGRNGAAVESALFGNSDRLKSSVLATAEEYVEVLGAAR